MSAILATIAVTSQDILPGKNHTLVRDAVINRKSKDARHRERSGYRPENPSVITFNKLCFPQIKQNYSLPPVANCKRLVILIQEQNFSVRSFMIASINLMVIRAEDSNTSSQGALRTFR